MKYATVTEARSQLPQLVESMERVALTRHGKPIAVLLDIQDYRNLALAEAMIKDPERLAAVHRDGVRFRQSGEREPNAWKTVPERLAETWAELGEAAAAGYEVRPTDLWKEIDKEDAKRALAEAMALVRAASEVLEARVHLLEDMAGQVMQRAEEERRAAEAG